ncbi:Rho-GTPase-activating protein 8 [Mycoemilia scoparia]|uniref:Rho-GTPase-activating protein 8 n=1 Tax=Mycoemilia scoparia TaxID=417184 RepID=A0A9W8DRD7_9FUNG|nr:Rho-GTPase-activating protein 8 [Mycoemilia scoparia]
MLSFKDAFWDNSGPGEPLDYRRSPSRLYVEVQHGANECDEILEFVQEWLRIEQSYANALQNLASKQMRPSGFGRNEGATLKCAFEGLTKECQHLVDVHTRLGKEMRSKVIRPMRDFATEHRSRINGSWKMIDSILGKASIEFVKAERARQVSHKRATLYESTRITHESLLAQKRETEGEGSVGENSTEQQQQQQAAQPEEQENGTNDLASASIIVGNLALTRHEFHVMLERLRMELPAHDVKFGVFGKFRGLVTGYDLVSWWRGHYSTVIKTEEEAVSIGQSLMDQGYLRYMGRGSGFQPRSNAYYQWKSAALQFTSDEESRQQTRSRFIPSGIDALRDRVSSSSDNPSDGISQGKTLAQLKTEAEEADQEYHSQVLTAEIYRSELEEQLSSYLEIMEAWELNRLTTMKSFMETFVGVQAKIVPVLLASNDRKQVCYETIKPSQDIQWIIEQHGTGRFVPRPIIYHKFGTSPAQTQIFGIPLDEQMLISTKAIPLFPAKALSLLKKSTAQMSIAEKRKIWTSEQPARLISELKVSVNSGYKVTLKDLRKFELPVVVNALYLYLSELPDCLCTRPLYDPIKSFYQGRVDKESPEERASGLRHILQSIPSNNLSVLKALFEQLSSLVSANKGKETEEDNKSCEEFIEAISQRVGPAILRPWQESVTVLHDKHQIRLVRDFLEYYSLMLEPVEFSNAPPPLPTRVVQANYAHDSDPTSPHSPKSDESKDLPAIPAESSDTKPKSQPQPASEVINKGVQSVTSNEGSSHNQNSKEKSSIANSTAKKSDPGLEGILPSPVTPAPFSVDFDSKESEKSVGGRDRSKSPTNQPGGSSHEQPLTPPTKDDMDFFLKDDDSDDDDN